MRPRRGPLAALSVLLLSAAACAGGTSSTASSTTTAPSTTTSVPATTTSGPTTTSVPTTTSIPTTTTTSSDEKHPLDLYPERVYVPNSLSNSVSLIDPHACEVTDTFDVGAVPHHITPSWDLTELYVYNTQGNSLTVLDPATGKPVREIPVEDPYNLYFTPDGHDAVVVAERFRRLDFYDPETWELRTSVPVEPPGVDHLAFSRHGEYLVASTEFAGVMVKVDLGAYEVVDQLRVGGLPVDVVRDPHDPRIMYVANQGLHGVHVIDAEAMTELAFVPTGRGAHGILLSKDMRSVYVSNRLEGSISVLDLETRTVVDTWVTGGSPDMGLLNPEGTQMWISNRYHGTVMGIDVTTGEVACLLEVGAQPHGVTYFPNEGTHSIGHNGLMIDESGANV